MMSSIRSTLVLLVMTATAMRAQGGVRIVADPGSKLWLEGTSNLMSWSCRATTLDAALQFDGRVLGADPAKIADRLEHVTVRVPVESLKCGNGRMDRNMYKALHSDRPEANQIFGTFAVLAEPSRNATVRTVGTLTVAGRNKTLDMDVRTRRAADGSIVAEGALPVLMTDFGIAPPTALFGAIRAGNRVVVRFELRLPADVALALNGGAFVADGPVSERNER
jgi:polyisoprenoid-binding protein YceI